jgi:hypothetical protein
MPWRSLGKWRYRSILDLGTRWLVVSFTLRSLYPQGKRPWTWGWVGQRVGLDGLDVVEKRKSLSSTANRTLSFQPVACRCNDWVIQAPMEKKSCKKYSSNTIVSSQLLSEMRSSQGCNCEDYCNTRCDAVQSGRYLRTVRRNVLPHLHGGRVITSWRLWNFRVWSYTIATLFVQA